MSKCRSLKNKLTAVSCAVCVAVSAAAFTSCGKEVSLGGSESSSGAQTSENAEAMNFTPPKEGDEIIEIKFKDYGIVRFRLFPEYAQKASENFKGLANEGYYDGVKFHRIIEDFMIQGGDPEGTGRGGESVWGGKFDGGTDPHLIHCAGAVSYANATGPSDNGSQFFIVTGNVYSDEEIASMEAQGYSFSDSAKKLYTTVGGTPWLDGKHTVFGQVFDGLDVVYTIQCAATDSSDRPIDDVVMEYVRVKPYDGGILKWKISDYDFEKPTEAPPENYELSNFTPPKEGEEVVVMDIKDYGEVKIKLFPEYADKGVENFVELAKQGYYDGLTFHRVISDFMIQGGDPNGDGTGGESVWGGEFDGGTDPHLAHAAGAIAYANSGPTEPNGSPTASDGSQFFIVTGKLYTEEELDSLKEYGYNFTDNQKKIYETAGGAPWLDGSYTIFGQVFSGLDLVFAIQNAETDEADKPLEDIIINSVRVEEYDGSEVTWLLSDYGYGDEAVDNEAETEVEASGDASEEAADETVQEATEEETEAAQETESE